MKRYSNILLFYFLPLIFSLSVASCALLKGNPNAPSIYEVETAAERAQIVYTKLGDIPKSINTIEASGSLLSKEFKTDIANSIDKFRMVVDLYVISQVPDLTTANRLKLQQGFGKDALLYNAAMNIYNGYENTAAGQMQAILGVNTLVVNLLKSLEKQ